MTSPSQSPKSDVLNSWKEIARYLGRGVRTVQRYERELGLPVRRPRGRARSAVIAFTAELDEWLRVTPKHVLWSAPREPLPAVITALRASVHETAQLRQLCQNLRGTTEEAIRTLMTTLQQTRELLQFTEQYRKDVTSTRVPSAGKDNSRPN